MIYTRFGRSQPVVPIAKSRAFSHPDFPGRMISVVRCQHPDGGGQCYERADMLLADGGRCEVIAALADVEVMECDGATAINI